MEKKTASAIMLTLLLTSMLMLAFNVQPVKAEPAEIIIDTEVGESRFTTYPPRQSPYYWVHVQDHDAFRTRAYGSNFWYTLCGADGTGEPLYYGTWQASLPSSGIYEVFVWIPNPDAFQYDGRTYTPTQSAIYQIYHKNGMDVRTVNQRLGTGSWYSVGTYTFDTTASVILNDRTGEPYLSTMLAFDAIKFVHVNNSPHTPSSPSPSNHATGVSIYADLSWSGGDPDTGDTVTYDVYFGTSPSPPLVSNDQSATTYDPGTLSYSTKYYWKIVATDNHGTSTPGFIWDFTTQSAPPEYRTFTVYSSPSGVTFTAGGVSHTTPWSETYLGGASVSLVMPLTHMVGEAKYEWDMWSDGVTSRFRTVVMDTHITLTAYYTGPYYQLDVTSPPITGIPFTIDGASKTTSYTDWLLQGSYTIEMPQTYSGYTWSYWFEDGDTNRIKTITLSSTTIWTAVYYPTSEPDFSISASPNSLTIQQGNSDTSTITIMSINGFNQPVQLSVSGAPSGVTTTLIPEQVTPPPDGSTTSTLTVSFDTTTTLGSYTLTVTGTSGALIHSTYISLEITATPPPPYTPTAVSQLRSETVVVTVIPEGGTTPEPTVVFKAIVSDPDGDSVRLEIELRQIGEAFTGEPTPETISDFVPSGTEVTITRFGLVNGGYHWQYRAKDSKGATSNWVEFGTPGNLDFTVSFPDIGYAIIVAGQGGWREQWIIDLNVKIAYRALRSLGFDDERILYLSNSQQDADGDGDNDVDMSSTLANFELAIERWAAMRVGKYSPLILYLSGHASNDPEIFFLDVNRNEGFAPDGLNSWLKACPQNTPMLIVIEACYSGCFITAPETISASNRIIITSTNDDKEGYPYLELFCREFWQKLGQGKNVKQAFVEGAEDANKIMTNTLWAGLAPPPVLGKFSQPWLDDNGDAIGHSPESLGDDGWFAETMKIGIPGIPLSLDLTFAHLCSPGEFRVYDSHGRVTGLIYGEVKEEIPNSVYIEEYMIVIIAFPIDSYLHEVVGLNYGAYGLTIDSVVEENVSIFTAIDIPTSAYAIHQYTVDWGALSLGEEGVTLQIDSDGDGVFEQIVTTDSELTYDEFMLQTATAIDFDPDTLNLGSIGNVVIVYVELPDGFNVSDINVGTILLNGTIPVDPLASIQIGDYDRDGIPDLIVKFNRTSISEYIISQNITYGNVTLTLTGQLHKAASSFQASDLVKVSALAGDVNCNGKVDISDIVQAASSYDSSFLEPNWNPNANFAPSWSIIDIFDLVTIASHYGETFP